MTDMLQGAEVVRDLPVDVLQPRVSDETLATAVAHAVDRVYGRPNEATHATTLLSLMQVTIQAAEARQNPEDGAMQDLLTLCLRGAQRAAAHFDLRVHVIPAADSPEAGA